MDEKQKNNNKVYINPNYKPIKGNDSTIHNQNIYINQNFVEPKTLSKGNRIFVNPNFLNLKNTNYESKVRESTSKDEIVHNREMSVPKNLCDNVFSKSRYTLIRRAESNKLKEKLDTNIDIQKNSNNQSKRPQLPVSNTRYKLIRQKENNDSMPQQLSPKPRILKINKYKMINLDNPLKSNHCEDRRNKLKPALRSSTPQKVLKLSVSNNKSMVKYNLTSYNKVKVVRGYTHKNQTIKGKMKINNIPCPLYSKYGKCIRNFNNKCPYVHDKRHVSLCRKFLKGICHDVDCSLSHELSMKKMPTCHFYLKGVCFKESCPYLHVKLNDKTNICRDFVRGYCEKGEKCVFRHVKQRKVVVVKSNSKSQSPVLKRMLVKRKNTARSINTESENQKNTETMNINEQNQGSNLEDCRYYKDRVNDNLNICNNIKPTRSKLGDLPSYIKF